MAELEAGTTTERSAPRPLSPHLQIYRLTLTLMMSIVHRITGAALYFGMLLLAWWLIAAAAGPNAYANFEWFIGSLIGRLVLFGYTWALLHHTLGGIRHLIWDTIHGFEPAERELLTLATIVGSIVAHTDAMGGRLSRHGRPAMRDLHADAHADAPRARSGRGPFRHAGISGISASPRSPAFR